MIYLKHLFPISIFEAIECFTYCYLWLGKIGDWTDEELDKTAEAVGYGAVK